MFQRQVRTGVELALVEQRHAQELFDLIEANRRYLRQWLNWAEQRRTVAETSSYITLTLRQFALNQGFHAGLWENEKLCGMINWHGIDWPHRAASLEYWLAESHQGKGLMTDACRVVIEYGFGTLGLHRFSIRCATENRRSRAIPERLGFSFEGVCRDSEWLYDHFVDHAIYGLLATDRKPA
jgi:ribosomal-protein-serine acetyltransferase